MFATILIAAFQASDTMLIQLYIVGVFVSFTLSQTGMLRHWNRLLRVEQDPVARRRMQRARAINAFDAVMTGFVLILVLATKFTHGAWISIAAMAAIYLIMVGIRRHYTTVAQKWHRPKTGRHCRPAQRLTRARICTFLLPMPWWPLRRMYSRRNRGGAV